MDKNSLVRFINKYYLDGVGNAVVLNSNSEKQQIEVQIAELVTESEQLVQASRRLF